MRCSSLPPQAKKVPGIGFDCSATPLRKSCILSGSVLKTLRISSPQNELSGASFSRVITPGPAKLLRPVRVSAGRRMCLRHSVAVYGKVDHGRPRQSQVQPRVQPCLGHHLGHVWGMIGACLGHHLGHVWGISGASSRTCLGQHLRHIFNNGQKSAVQHAFVMPFFC